MRCQETSSSGLSEECTTSTLARLAASLGVIICVVSPKCGDRAIDAGVGSRAGFTGSTHTSLEESWPLSHSRRSRRKAGGGTERHSSEEKEAGLSAVPSLSKYQKKKKKKAVLEACVSSGPDCTWVTQSQGNQPCEALWLF